MALDVNPGETLEDFTKRAAEYYATCMAAAVAVVETAAEVLNMEQATAEAGERFEQMPFERTRIDREAGILYGVRVMGIKSVWGYEYSLEAQRAVAGRYEQMPVGLDHAYDGKPLQVAEAWGTLFNPRVDEKGTLADMKFLKTHVRTEQILEDAERDVGLFSLSAVTQVRREKNKVVTDFMPVRCDLVVKGATTKRLFEQAAAPNAEVEALKAESLKAEFADLKTRLVMLGAVATRHEQAIAAKTALHQTIQMATAGVDLKSFWNDPK